MKDTVKSWENLGYRIKLEDIKRIEWEGYIVGCDEVGVAIQLSKKEIKSIQLFTWHSIYKIERC